MIKSIKELLEKYPRGKGLTVAVDNDCTYVYLTKDLNNEKKDPNHVFEGEGYRDVVDLWNLAFPDADECDWV